MGSTMFAEEIIGNVPSLRCGGGGIIENGGKDSKGFVVFDGERMVQAAGSECLRTAMRSLTACVAASAVDNMGILYRWERIWLFQ
eukprot:2771768-Ditylum_brightwellii.AAC.1